MGKTKPKNQLQRIFESPTTTLVGLVVALVLLVYVADFISSSFASTSRFGTPQYSDGLPTSISSSKVTSFITEANEAVVPSGWKVTASARSTTIYEGFIAAEEYRGQPKYKVKLATDQTDKSYSIFSQLECERGRKGLLVLFETCSWYNRIIPLPTSQTLAQYIADQHLEDAFGEFNISPEGNDPQDSDVLPTDNIDNPPVVPPTDPDDNEEEEVDDEQEGDSAEDKAYAASSWCQLFGHGSAFCQADLAARTQTQYFLDRLATVLSRPVYNAVSWTSQVLGGFRLMTDNVNKSVLPLVEALYKRLVNDSGQVGEVVENPHRDGARIRAAVSAMQAYHTDPNFGTDYDKAQRIRDIEYALQNDIVSLDNRGIYYQPYTVASTPTLYYAESGGYEFVGTWDGVLKEFRLLNASLPGLPHVQVKLPSKSDAIVIDNQCDALEWRELVSELDGRLPFVYKFNDRVFGSCQPSVSVVSEDFANRLTRDPRTNTIDHADAILTGSSNDYVSNWVLFEGIYPPRDVRGSFTDAYADYFAQHSTPYNGTDKIYQTAIFKIPATEENPSGKIEQRFPAYWVRAEGRYTNMVHNVMLDNDFMENPQSITVRTGDTVRLIVPDAQMAVQLVSFPSACRLEGQGTAGWNAFDPQDPEDCRSIYTQSFMDSYNAERAIGALIYGGSAGSLNPEYTVEGVPVSTYLYSYEYKVTEFNESDLVFLLLRKTSDGRGIINLGTTLGTKAFLLSHYVAQPLLPR